MREGCIMYSTLYCLFIEHPWWDHVFVRADGPQHLQGLLETEEWIESDAGGWFRADCVRSFHKADRPVELLREAQGVT